MEDMRKDPSTSVRNKDNGGRRRMSERRRYTHTDFFPERRATRYRRSGYDRRRRPEAVLSQVLEKREAFKQMPSGAESI